MYLIKYVGLSKIRIVAYFSHKGMNYSNGSIINLSKGNAETAAEMIADHTGADLFVIAALFVMVLSIAISKPLPRWPGGDEVLWHDASAYFPVFAIPMPFMELNWLASGFLQSAGNMVVPSVR